MFGNKKKIKKVNDNEFEIETISLKFNDLSQSEVLNHLFRKCADSDETKEQKMTDEEKYKAISDELEEKNKKIADMEKKIADMEAEKETKSNDEEENEEEDKANDEENEEETNDSDEEEKTDDEDEEEETKSGKTGDSLDIESLEKEIAKMKKGKAKDQAVKVLAMAKGISTDDSLLNGLASSGAYSVEDSNYETMSLSEMEDLFNN